METNKKYARIFSILKTIGILVLIVFVCGCIKRGSGAKIPYKYDHGGGILRMQSNFEYIFYISPTYSLDKVENYYLEWSCKKAEFFKREKVLTDSGRFSTTRRWGYEEKKKYCSDMLSALHKALSERFPEWQESKDDPDIKFYAELEGVQALYPSAMYIKIIRWDTVVAERRFKRYVLDSTFDHKDPTSPKALRRNAEEMIQFIAAPGFIKPSIEEEIDEALGY